MTKARVWVFLWVWSFAMVMLSVGCMLGMAVAGMAVALNTTACWLCFAGVVIGAIGLLVGLNMDELETQRRREKDNPTL